jgi:hydrogenase maturation protease
MSLLPRPLAVIGIGNPQRGDDAAGPLAARLLREQLPSDIEVIVHDGEVSSLLAQMDGYAAVYLIDACMAGAAAGAVHRFDLNTTTLPADQFAVSTHGLGLAQAIELARVLGQLPSHCILYGIEALGFAVGAMPSAPVAVAIAEVAARVRDEISD